MRIPAWLPGLHSGVCVWLLIAFCATAIACILMFPFDFSRNGVHWLDARPGLYFDGRGIAQTAQRIEHSDGEPLNEMTFELWIRERGPSENWRSGVVLSLYDGTSSFPLIMGIRGGRVFAFDIDEPWGSPWMNQFLVEHKLVRSEDHFVALTVDRAETSIFVNGGFVARRRRTPKEPNWLSGRIVLGTAPENFHPWEGELLGLAIYGQVLSSADLERHETQARRAGIRALVQDDRLLALFPFDEGAGEYARNLVPGGPDLFIPSCFSGLPGVLFDLPGRQSFSIGAFLLNIPANVVLFVPLGWLLGIVVAGASANRRRCLALAAIAAGGVLSFTFEAVQLLLPTRQPALVDVVANTIGTAVGTFASLAWRNR